MVQVKQCVHELTNSWQDDIHVVAQHLCNVNTVSSVHLIPGMQQPWPRLQVLTHTGCNLASNAARAAVLTSAALLCLQLLSSA